MQNCRMRDLPGLPFLPEIFSRIWFNAETWPVRQYSAFLSSFLIAATIKRIQTLLQIERQTPVHIECRNV